MTVSTSINRLLGLGALRSFLLLLRGRGASTIASRFFHKHEAFVDKRRRLHEHLPIFDKTNVFAACGTIAPRGTTGERRVLKSPNESFASKRRRLQHSHPHHNFVSVFPGLGEPNALGSPSSWTTLQSSNNFEHDSQSVAESFASKSRRLQYNAVISANSTPPSVRGQTGVENQISGPLSYSTFSGNIMASHHNVERLVLQSNTLNESVVDTVSPPPRDDVPPFETGSTLAFVERNSVCPGVHPEHVISASVNTQARDVDMVGFLGHPRGLAIGDDDGAAAGVPQELTRLFHPPER